jgi:hypothetical protein
MEKISEEKAKEKLLKEVFPKFPTTEKEVEEFEKNNDIENIELPEKLKNPSEILKNGYICIKHKKLPNAYEFHNLKTGHCYVDYIPRKDMGLEDGYSQIPLYKD